MNKVLVPREALRNSETGEIRVAFDVTGLTDTVIVVKFFDSIQRERFTCKWFVGVYDAVKSHWRTHEPVDLDDELLTTALAVFTRCQSDVLSISAIPPTDPVDGNSRRMYRKWWSLMGYHQFGDNLHVTLLHGGPSCGKTTYIRSSRSDASSDYDVIIDTDDVVNMLGVKSAATPEIIEKVSTVLLYQLRLIDTMSSARRVLILSNIWQLQSTRLFKELGIYRWDASFWRSPASFAALSDSEKKGISDDTYLQWTESFGRFHAKYKVLIRGRTFLSQYMMEDGPWMHMMRKS